MNESVLVVDLVVDLSLWINGILFLIAYFMQPKANILQLYCDILLFAFYVLAITQRLVHDQKKSPKQFVINVVKQNIVV